MAYFPQNPIEVPVQEKREVGEQFEASEKLLKTPKQLKQDSSGFTYHVLIENTPFPGRTTPEVEEDVKIQDDGMIFGHDNDDDDQIDMQDLDSAELCDDDSVDDDDDDFDILPDPKAFVKQILSEVPQEIQNDEKFFLFNDKVPSNYSKNPEKVLIMQKLTQKLQEILYQKLQSPKNTQISENDVDTQQTVLPRWDFEVQKAVLRKTQETLDKQIALWTQQCEQSQINQFVNQQLPLNKEKVQNAQNQQNVDVHGMICEQINCEDVQDQQNIQKVEAESQQQRGQLLKCRRNLQLQRMLEMAEYVDKEERLELYLEELEQKLEDLEQLKFKQRIKQYDHLQSPAVLISNLINQEDYMME